jgi:kynurenine formamidase
MKGTLIGLIISCAIPTVDAGPTQADTELKTIAYSRVLDLSHNIDTDIPLWPGDPPVEFETVATFDSDGYYLRRFSMGEHSGTHMNASNSFLADGIGIDEYPVESRVVQAVVMDVREQALEDPDYALSIPDVIEWERLHGQVPAGSVVVLYTGWQEKWDDPVAFFNEDDEGGLHFPGFSPAATRFLLRQRDIGGVGIDTHGVDPGWDETYATNTQVHERNGIVLECLTNLDQLPATGTTLVLGPLSLKNGSGSPLSVMAFVP